MNDEQSTTIVRRLDDIMQRLTEIRSAVYSPDRGSLFYELELLRKSVEDLEDKIATMASD